MKSESEFIFMRYIASAQKFGKHKCPQVFHYLKNHKNHCWFTKVCKWWWWFEVKSRNDNSTKISGHLSYIPSSLYICYFLFHLTFAIFKQSSNPRHDVITIILLLWNLPPSPKKKVCTVEPERVPQLRKPDNINFFFYCIIILWKLFGYVALLWHLHLVQFKM